MMIADNGEQGLSKTVFRVGILQAKSYCREF